MKTRIKICGITTPEDATMAAREGADFVGIVLTASPRQVTAQRARDIGAALEPPTLLVAVFAAETPEEVARSIEGLPVHAVQVRGWDDASPGSAYEVWHVLRDAALPDPATLPMVPLRTYLLDAADAALPGGTGKREIGRAHV